MVFTIYLVTENDVVNVYNILMSSCLIVAFTRLELGDNIVYILCQYKQSSIQLHVQYSIYNFTSLYCMYTNSWI